MIFHNNIVNISEKKNEQTVTCLKVTYPTDFCKICSRFCYGEKSENILCFLIPVTRIELLLCKSSYGKRFCIKSWQKCAKLLCIKCQAENDFLEDVESTVGNSAVWSRRIGHGLMSKALVYFRTFSNDNISMDW